jgi:hypothetical protein
LRAGRHEHTPTSATGTAWERTPWHATQRAAWEALKKNEEGDNDATAKGGADHRAVRAHPRFDACHRICVVLWAHSYEVWVDGNKTEHRREVAWNKMAHDSRQVRLREPLSEGGAC